MLPWMVFVAKHGRGGGSRWAQASSALLAAGPGTPRGDRGDSMQTDGLDRSRRYPPAQAIRQPEVTEGPAPSRASLGRGPSSSLAQDRSIFITFF